ASNNLAYVMLQQGGNIDMAISLAQTARRLMPDSPNAADTLGWAYYKKGLYPTAIDLFKEALKKVPNDPTFQEHLRQAQQAQPQAGNGGALKNGGGFSPAVARTGTAERMSFGFARGA